MTLTKKDQIQGVILTLAAAEAVQNLLDKRNIKNHALRIFIQGGGCSGVQYGMALDDNIRESDFAFDHHGIQIIVDDVSMNYIFGSTIDYVEDIMGSGFKVDNPNAMSQCGCGSSFQTEGDASANVSNGDCNSCY